MPIYNKLVRDRIPEIIQESGKDCETRTLESQEYGDELKKKLEEEVTEFIGDDGIDEMADILEVLHAIAAYKGIQFSDIEKKRVSKREERGGFDDRVFLIAVDE